MYTLILNLSESILQIVLAEKQDSFPPRILLNQELECYKNSTEKLTPLLAEIFEKFPQTRTSLSRIAAVTGAGSFTGIRLTLLTAAALARTLAPFVDGKRQKVEQVGIDFLLALSYNAPARTFQSDTMKVQEAHIRVITHAKRNLVHCADFCAEKDCVEKEYSEKDCVEKEYSEKDNVLFTSRKALGATRLISPEEAREGEYHYILGSGVAKYPHIFAQEKRALDISANTLNPLVLAYLSHSLPALPENEDIEANYIRNCDAIDNLDHISMKMGNNPQSAHLLLEQHMAHKNPEEHLL